MKPHRAISERRHTALKFTELGSARRVPAVVSPLIALQKDQLNGLLGHWGEAAIVINPARPADPRHCGVLGLSDYHQADEQFHQLVDTSVEAYHETLAELYAYFIPYPIELLHKSNCDHVALVAALRAGDVQGRGSRGSTWTCFTGRCSWV